MTAEFQFAHFSPVVHQGVYRVCLYRQNESSLFPEDFDLMGAAEQEEVFRKVMRKATLMLTLTTEAACDLMMTGLSVVCGLDEIEAENFRHRLLDKLDALLEERQAQDIAA